MFNRKWLDKTDACERDNGGGLAKEQPVNELLDKMCSPAQDFGKRISKTLIYLYLLRVSCSSSFGHYSTSCSFQKSPAASEIVSWRISNFFTSEKVYSHADAARSQSQHFCETCRLGFLHNDKIHHDMLLKARTQMDLDCMMIWRQYFLIFDFETTFFYLSIDAGPQWRGKELFASSIDVLHFGEPFLFQRRLMPQIQIARHMYGLLGKTIAVMWQLWPLFGPSYSRMRRACNNVAGITSDLGTERQVPDYKDILTPFLCMVSVPTPQSLQHANNISSRRRC